jgi:hypothetical protein
MMGTGLRRLYVAVMVLALSAGLAVPGGTVTVTGNDTGAPAIAADGAVDFGQGDCSQCDSAPTGVVCVAAPCFALSAALGGGAAATARSQARRGRIGHMDPGAGLARRPDPHPPRIPARA